MNHKCIIIDADKNAIDAFFNYVSEMPNLNVYATFTNPIEAVTAIKPKDQIDFIFMDIEMLVQDGFELAKTLRSKSRFLILTAIASHSSHAIIAFDSRASHYLIKPISFGKFALTITELLMETTKDTVRHGQNKINFIKADQKNAYHYIDSDEILYIEASKNYVVIFSANEMDQYITHMGLGQIESILDPSLFIRIHKSYIIAKGAIKKVEGNLVKLKSGKNLQIGGLYKASFAAFIKEGLLKVKSSALMLTMFSHHYLTSY